MDRILIWLLYITAAFGWIVGLLGLTSTILAIIFGWEDVEIAVGLFGSPLIIMMGIAMFAIARNERAKIKEREKETDV